MIYRISVLSAFFLVQGALCAWPWFPPLVNMEKDKPPGKLETRYRALGPLVSHAEDEEDRRQVSAFRPLWSMETGESNSAVDFLWPLYVYRGNDFESYWRFILLYSGSGSKETPEHGNPHTGLIPLFLYGRDREVFYGGVFPVFGSLRDFLSYDSMQFVLFPCYLRTEKNGAVGESYLWPFIDWEKGARHEKLRIFPFYSYHRRHGFFMKESWGWPVFHREKYLSGENSGSAWLFWPLAGRRKSGNYRAWTTLWPFFILFRNAENDGFGLYCPWPFFQYKRDIPSSASVTGEKVSKLFFWPLWGRQTQKSQDYMFFIWPLGSRRNVRAADGKIRWIWALPLFWSKDSWDKNGDLREKYRRFWPFASWLRRGDKTVFRMLDVWPERNMPVIERNWHPLWELFRYSSTPAGEAYDLFWGALSYVDSAETGERITILPFYTRRVAAEVDGGSGKHDPGAVTVRHDIFMGALSIFRRGDGSSTARLLWFIDL